MRLELYKNLVAVHIGYVHIKENEVGLLHLGGPQRLGPI
jgi:hypothetical protein